MESISKQNSPTMRPKYMNVQLKRDKTRCEALSLQRTARICYMFAYVCLLTFLYSFIVSEPGAFVDPATKVIEEGHFQFLTGGRWYFFTGVFLSVGLGLFSVSKANKL